MIGVVEPGVIAIAEPVDDRHIGASHRIRDASHCVRYPGTSRPLDARVVARTGLAAQKLLSRNLMTMRARPG